MGNKPPRAILDDPFAQTQPWMPIEEAGVESWHNTMHIHDLPSKTYLLQGAKMFAPAFCRLRRNCDSSHGLWYTEAKDYLVQNGLRAVIPEGPLNTCFSHSRVNGAEDLYVRQHASDLMASTSPVLMSVSANGTDTSNVMMWAANTVQEMHFAGCAYTTNLPRFFTHVRLLYVGEKIPNRVIATFLRGVPWEEPKRYVYRPTVAEIETAIKERNIPEWRMHTCSICDYKCGYVFHVSPKAVRVMYDNGCYCGGPGELRPSTVQDVVSHIHLQHNKNAVLEMRHFWQPEKDGDELVCENPNSSIQPSDWETLVPQQ